MMKMPELPRTRGPVVDMRAYAAARNRAVVREACTPKRLVEAAFAGCTANISDPSGPVAA